MDKVFDITTADTWVDELNKGIKAPHLGINKSTLGGDQHVSILMAIGLDKEEEWKYGIFENSRYLKLHLFNDGVMELISSNVKPAKYFRKTRVKDVKDAINKINRYIDEVNKITNRLAGIGSRIAREVISLRYRFTNLKDDFSSWYNEPKMMGHTWAKVTVDELERIVNKYGTTSKQRFIIDKIFDFGQTDWHYFNMMSKKSLALTLFVLKNIGSKGAIDTLWTYTNKSGLWRENIEKILHVMAYDENPERYLSVFGKGIDYMGLTDEAARERAINMVESFRTKMGM